MIRDYRRIFPPDSITKLETMNIRSVTEAVCMTVLFLISHPATVHGQPTEGSSPTSAVTNGGDAYERQSGYETAFGTPEDVPHPKEVRALSYENEPGYEAAFGRPDDLPEPHESLMVSQQAIIDAQSRQLRRVEVVTSAQVWRLLPTDNKGLRHQKFLIRLNNGTAVLVANDLTVGQMVPVNPGDTVEIKGEYIWTSRGGVLHWTHRSDNDHPGGWIRLGDQIYQ